VKVRGYKHKWWKSVLACIHKGLRNALSARLLAYLERITGYVQVAKGRRWWLNLIIS